MKNVFRVAKKELDKIFRFPRTIFTTLILPGLMLFLIYAFIGNSFGKMADDAEAKQSVIYLLNMPESLSDLDLDLEELNIAIEETDEDNEEELSNLILDGNIDAVIIYDSNFDADLANSITPKVKVLYAYTMQDSTIAADRIYQLIAIHQNAIFMAFSMDQYIINITPMTVETETSGSAAILSMILPMLLMTFIFAGAMGIGADTIAGEKERGTLATLLMLPVKRREIIFGKIISTFTITLLTALSSMIGLLLSLPFSKAIFAIEGSVSYGFNAILGLFVILFIIALFAATVLLIISTIAKTIKEASTMAMPIYLVAMITPTISMFSSKPTTAKGLYLIPLYNTILGLKEILSLKFDLLNFVLIVGSNIVYIGLFIVILIKLFNSERVLYSK